MGKISTISRNGTSAGVPDTIRANTQTYVNVEKTSSRKVAKTHDDSNSLDNLQFGDTLVIHHQK